MKKDHLRLAIKGVLSKRLRSYLTMIGIFIGVAAVVSLIGLGEGLRSAITSQFGISSTQVLAVQAGGLSAAGPPGTGVINPLTIEDAEAIEKASDVEIAFARLIRGGALLHNDRSIISFSTNIPNDPKKREFVYEVLDLSIEKGRLLRESDSNKVVLGYNFYASEGELGKTIDVGDKIEFGGKTFEVVGILKKKGSFILDGIVLMNEDALRDLFGIKDRADVIAVKAKDKNRLDEAKDEVEKILRKRRGVKIGEEDFRVDTPQSALSTVNDVLFGVQVFIVIVASISILVGALGIVNTMLTAVLERKSQIGVMKAIGAKNSDVFYMFFFESGMLGLIGGLVGVIIGSLISYAGTAGINAFLGSTNAPHLSFTLILSSLLASFLLGSIAGIIPAMRAASQNPVDSLRG